MQMVVTRTLSIYKFLMLPSNYFNQKFNIAFGYVKYSSVLRFSQQIIMTLLFKSSVSETMAKLVLVNSTNCPHSKTAMVITNFLKVIFFYTFKLYTY